MDNNLSNKIYSWGWEIFSSLDELKLSRDHIPGYSEWGKRTIEKETLIRRGILVWNYSLQKVVILSAKSALQLLETLQSSPVWLSEGVVVNELVTALPLHECKITQSARAGYSNTTMIETPQWETKEAEILRFDANAIREFKVYLQGHRLQLDEFSKQDEEYRANLLAEVYRMILSW